MNVKSIQPQIVPLGKHNGWSIQEHCTCSSKRRILHFHFKRHFLSYPLCCNIFFIFLIKKKKKSGLCECKPTPKIKGEMFCLRQLEAFAGLGTWDPCLTAGIDKEPAASLSTRCCFIYLKAQVTFQRERRSETCL